MKDNLANALIIAMLLGLLIAGMSCTRTIYVTPAPTPTPILTPTPTSTPTPTPILVPDRYAAQEIVRTYLLDSATTPHGKDVLALVWNWLFAPEFQVAKQEPPSSLYPYGRWIVTFYFPPSAIENSTLLTSIFQSKFRFCGSEFNFETMTPVIESYSCDVLTDKNASDFGVFYSMSWTIGLDEQVNPYEADAIRFLAELSR
jgi:hypothetical protein